MIFHWPSGWGVCVTALVPSVLFRFGVIIEAIHAMLHRLRPIVSFICFVVSQSQVSRPMITFFCSTNVSLRDLEKRSIFRWLFFVVRNVGCVSVCSYQ